MVKEFEHLGIISNDISDENVDFKKPVFAGDELFVTATVKDKQDDLHLIILDVVIRNQNNKVVSKASMKVLVQK